MFCGFIKKWGFMNFSKYSGFFGALASFLVAAPSYATTADLPTTGIKLSADADSWLASGEVKNIGDFNNDGYDDFMIGVAYNDEGGDYAGKVYLFYGSATRRTAMDIADADATFTGSEGRIAGSDISGGGDVNNDGCDDVLIGAGGIWMYSVTDGRAYLLYGKGTGCASTATYSGAYSLDSDSSAIFKGKTSGDYAGMSVAVAKDVNGDGYDDILIGGDGNDDGGSNAGVAYLIYGKSSQFSGSISLSRVDTRVAVSTGKFSMYLPAISGVILKGAATNNYVGISVGSAGDINKDGYGDILVGRMGSSAASSGVYLVKGSASLTSTDLSSADAFYEEEASGDKAFEVPDNWGDLDGDGCDDIVIGARGNDSGGTNAGRTYVFYGSGIKCVLAKNVSITETTILSGSGSGTGTRSSGSTKNLSTAGVIYTGEGDYYAAGEDLSFAGDINGNGKDELLIGSPRNDDDDPDHDETGKAYLIYGSASLASSSLSAADIIFTDDAWAHAGSGLSGGGDVDGDGTPDPLVLSAGSNVSGSTNYGAAYILYDL